MAGLVDRDGIRLDPHALAARPCRTCCGDTGGEIVTNARVSGIRHDGRGWIVTTERGQTFSAPVVINAAGAWADAVAELAGLGTASASCRSAARSSPSTVPRATTSRGWPFAKTVGDELYFAPESGRLFASPMDEVPTEPCDAQPDEYEVALAAHRVEERTTMKVGRIHSRWAGLRTFAPDRHLVAGFDPTRGGLLLARRAGRFRPSDLAGNGGDRGIADRRHAMADRDRRCRRVKPRPLPRVGVSCRPSGRRPGRTAAASTLRPTC